MSLPAEAIFEEESRHYVLVKESKTKDGISFKKVEVETGISDSEYIEIKTERISDVLISGVYYLVNNE
jgi:hypothetical protein